MKKENKKKVKNVPTSLRVISVLFYVFAVLSILLGIIFLVIGIGGNSYIDSVGNEAFVQQILELNPNAAEDLQGIDLNDIELLKSMLLIVGIVGGIVTIGLGILYLFVARGLIQRKKWAWIAALILVALGILRYIIGGILGSSSSIVILVILLVIGYFLVFDKEIRKIFV